MVSETVITGKEKRARRPLRHYRKHRDGVVVAGASCILPVSLGLTWTAAALGQEEREVLPFLALARLAEQHVRPLHLLVAQLSLQEHRQGHPRSIHLSLHLHGSTSLSLSPPITRNRKGTDLIQGPRNAKELKSFDNGGSYPEI